MPAPYKLQASAHWHIGILTDHHENNRNLFRPCRLRIEGICSRLVGSQRLGLQGLPDFAHPLALAVEAGECYPGIAICGSGEGISITLNKHQGIRAALCWTAEIAHLARQHNDANVLVMPGRFISTEEADMIMREFFSTPFEGGRHQRRVDKIPVHL